MKCKVIVIIITDTYCFHYFSMYRRILSALTACVVNLRSGIETEGLESIAGILEVLQVLEGKLEGGGVQRGEAVLWVFQQVFVLLLC